MTRLVLNNIDDDVRDGLTNLARRHGRTVEEEAREILRGAVIGGRKNAEGSDGNLGSRIAARFSSAGGLEQGISELSGQTAVPPDLVR